LEGEGIRTCNHNSKHTATVIPRNQYITNVAEIAYLNDKPANDADTPVLLPMQINLGTMTQETSGWQQLLTAINTANKLVDLDLSTCTMSGTEFNPVADVATGKDKIISIALPDTAESTASGTYSVPTFIKFTSLKSFSGTGLKTIGDYAFYGCTSLALTELPSGLTSIGNSAFYNCTNLVALTALPSGLTSTGGYVFVRTNLTQFTLHSGITSIGVYAFYECTNLLSVTFEGTIAEANFGTLSFPGDLRAKYLATGGGIGTYTRPTPAADSGTWTKQE
jgi:hypothetical protein